MLNHKNYNDLNSQEQYSKDGKNPKQKENSWKNVELVYREL